MKCTFLGIRWLSRSKDANRNNEKLWEQIFGLSYDAIIEIAVAYTGFGVLALKFLPG